MKTPRLLFVISFAAVAGCDRKLAEEPPAPDSTARAALIPAPVATPEYAPPGVFYLLASARIETRDGIAGLTPGTSVKLVRPGVYLSSSGEIRLRADQVTNDLTRAHQLMTADRQAQASLKAGLAAQLQIAAAPPRSRPLPAINTPGSAPAAIALATKEPLERETRMAQLQSEISSVLQQISDVNDRIMEHNAHAAKVAERTRGRPIESSSLSGQKEELESKLHDMAEELQRLKSTP